MGKLDGKVALVTGGASGIGAGCAEILAREGASVVITDIQDLKGEALAADIAKAGGKARYLHHDVTSEDAWVAVISDVKAKEGRLDVLVNNAGIGVGAPSITEMSLADWRRQQAINVEGVFLGIKHGLPLLRASGNGAIVNVASTTALTGSANLVSYAATKGAVRSLTRSVALQCAARKDGVRANTVYPGIIDTPIYGLFEGVPKVDDKGNKPLARDPHALGERFVPLGIPGQPHDVAAGILYLASDDARYLTGTDLVIDGGLAG
jgi:NAD(P)-dependent dehydrogenase (short-subunit alcohol dehydrogenase family)